MPASDELLNQINECIHALQDAQETVLNGVERLGNAVHKTGEETIADKKIFSVSPDVPTPTAGDNSAKAASAAFVTGAVNPVATKAQSALDKAETAQSTANTAKTTADAALPRAGGVLTGNQISYKMPFNMDTLPGSLQYIAFPAMTADAKGNDIIVLRGWYGVSGDVIAELMTRNKIGDKFEEARIGVLLQRNGISYAHAPHPRDNLGADIVTTSYAKNKFPLKLTNGTNIYVGGANASDTADLFCGRGFSPDKPFATLEAAINFISANYVSWRENYIVLQSDVAIGEYYYFAPQIEKIVVKSNSVKRTITFNGRIIVGSGILQLDNVNLAAGPNLNQFFCAMALKAYQN